MPARESSPAPSHSAPSAGFAPGAMLADRYRIIAMLGKGGMGEVYRADDLKLGQAVALKFLPRKLSSDLIVRERFYAEVRITRQLSHPNICRVYDIAESDGQHFLSMEYVDGEDLASLLKRIGYLPNEKALDITRQLLSGVAAAHERGVLHRDLKPANIMIDGRGRVRIMDFGLAITSHEAMQVRDISGTPAYMAPEQFSGKPATVQSDLYSMGLILYEVFTGKKAFDAKTIAELREQKEGQVPRAPSQMREGINPLVDKLIVGCLDRDPRLRPASAAQIAMALPGGDPLAAALAAGETPSPELVAASGLREGLRPAVALVFVAIIIAGAAAVIAMNPRTMLQQRVTGKKAPAVLIDRAREYIRSAGYTYEDADAAFGFESDDGFIRYVQSTDNSRHRWDKLDAYNSVLFWYRQSPYPLERVRWMSARGSGISPDDPPMRFSGEVLLRLDSEGRLRSFQAIPPEKKSAGTSQSKADWDGLFAQAGLAPSAWTPVRPDRNPLYYAESQSAWKGMLPGVPNVEVRIEAAAYGARIVSFEILGPWTQASRTPTAPVTREDVRIGLFILILAMTMAASLYFARRNLLRGRGDRRGATRLALAMFGSGLVGWILNEHHVATVWELGMLSSQIGMTIWGAVMTWVMYIALEPFVRCRWPRVLVSWTRLLAGEWRDPLLGREVLAGSALGVAIACLDRMKILAPGWLGYPEESLLERSVNYAFSTGTSAARLVDGVAFSIFDSLVLLLLFVLLRTLLRNEWITAVVWVLILSFTLASSAQTPWLAGIFACAIASLGLFGLIRFGLVAVIVGLMVSYIFLNYPMTFTLSAWYSGIGYIALFVVGVISLYGFRISLGGRRILEEPPGA